MELKTIDLSAERKLLTNLIVSDEFCKRIVPIFNPIYCKSKYAQIISEWIVEFYNVYKKFFVLTQNAAFARLYQYEPRI